MQDSPVSFGLYPIPPAADDVDICHAINKGQPEKIIGLSWSKPDFTLCGHKIVRAFAIDRKKRPGLDCIPCAMCSGGHPKFLEGALLWSPDKHLRLIGHQCAERPEHFGVARYRQLRQQRDQEELDRVALAWLEAYIHDLPPLVPIIRKIRRCADCWERTMAAFFRNVPDLARAIENICRRQHGQVTVEQALSETRLAAVAENGPNIRQYEQIILGSLRGQPLFCRPRNPHHRWVSRLTSSQQVFEQVPVGIGDAPLMAVIDEGGEVAVNRTAGLSLRAIQNTLLVAEQIAEAELFVSPGNLSLLDIWGKDRRNFLNFTLEQSPARVIFKLADLSRGAIPRTFERLPDLSSLQTLADAGSNLDELLRRHGRNDGDVMLTALAA